MKTLLVFLFDFLRCWNVVHYIFVRNSEMCHKIVKFWATKVAKIIRILYFFSMFASAKKFAKFQCFDKNMTNSIFFQPKTLIKTKYIFQKQEKVETEKSI